MVKINHLTVRKSREQIRWDLHCAEITFTIENWARIERKWTGKKWAAVEKKTEERIYSHEKFNHRIECIHLHARREIFVRIYVKEFHRCYINFAQIVIVFVAHLQTEYSPPMSLLYWNSSSIYFVESKIIVSKNFEQTYFRSDKFFPQLHNSVIFQGQSNLVRISSIFSQNLRLTKCFTLMTELRIFLSFKSGWIKCMWITRKLQFLTCQNERSHTSFFANVLV